MHTVYYAISLSHLDICYNISLCYYKMKQYANALKYITEIIERGIKEHPGLLMCAYVHVYMIYVHVLYYIHVHVYVLYVIRIKCWIAN